MNMAGGDFESILTVVMLVLMRTFVVVWWEHERLMDLTAV